jgi:hypothetical protein
MLLVELHDEQKDRYVMGLSLILSNFMDYFYEFSSKSESESEAATFVYT